MTAVVVDPELAALYRSVGSDSLPAYERVKKLISTMIESGRWAEGDQLPSENRLVDVLALSRMTINRAFRELAAQGVVHRVMGVGTFVAPAKAPSALFEVKNIADEVRERGHDLRTDVVHLRRELHDDLPAIARAAFPGDVFHSRLVHFESGVPIQVEERYVNPDEAPSYLEQDFTTTTPNSYLIRVAPMVRGEHVVEAVLGSPEDCRLLEVSRREPCLQIRRRTYSARALVSVTRLLYPGSRSRLEGTI